VDELKQLVAMLRELGVTRYEGPNGEGERVVLELGAAPAQRPGPELGVGAADLAARPSRSPELQAALARLDAQYSDPSLFAITEVRR
jgi:hypothetical protein